MKRLLVLPLFAAGLLAGCEPAPSTPLAPDVPVDTKAAPPADLSEMKKQEHQQGRS